MGVENAPKYFAGDFWWAIIEDEKLEVVIRWGVNIAKHPVVRILQHSVP
jgi:hypothetical protein